MPGPLRAVIRSVTVSYETEVRMIRRTAVTGFAVTLALIIWSCAESPIDVNDANESRLSKGATDALPQHAEVIFGTEQAGSPFPPAEEHDHSGHARDKMVPRTVVIGQGGEVTYHVAPFHQVAVYADGKKASDIEEDIASGDATLEDLTDPFFIPDFIIDDPVDRIALSPPLVPGEFMWTTPEGTFDEPGRYLVICTTTPHFLSADMYGWVIVK